MFFAPVLVLVEGLEDQALITAHAVLTECWDEFRRYGVCIVPVHGKEHLIRPYAVSKRLGILTFLVFDCDSDELSPDRRTKHERDNMALLRLAGSVPEHAFPDQDLWASHVVAWKTRITEPIFAELAGPKFTSHVSVHGVDHYAEAAAR